jgi:response regulator of citrate/malate metabolism
MLGTAYRLWFLKLRRNDVNQLKNDICRMTLLYVDDDADIRMMMNKILSRNYMNQKILFAESGLHAKRLINEHQPDIFMIDLHMSFLDGFELSRELLNYNKEYELMLLPTDSGTEVIERCLRLGVKYALKPIDFDKLIYKIDTMMENIFWKRLTKHQILKSTSGH